MKLGSFEAIVRAFDKASVRYLVAGGSAVNAHGYLRFTRDVDVVLKLVPDNIVAAFGAMAAVGYRPLVPVSNFWSDAHRDTPIDIFATEPFDFEEEYGRALVKPLGPVQVRFVSIASLIRMKEIASRPQDKFDIEYLRKLDGAGK